MVLSGYLITDLLVREHHRRGRVRLGSFWLRRLRRLAPAMLFLLAAVVVWTHLDAPRALVPTIRSQGFAALLYASNWRLVLDAVTYGGATAAESPFVHLWSLAVEAQFYVVWAVVVGVLLATTRSRRAVAIVAAAGAAASAIAMAVLYEPGGDPFRIYYGTDTRAQAFLAGALVAAASPIVGRAQRVAALGAPLALVAILATFLADEPGLLYRGGFLLVAALTAALVAGASGPAVTWLLDRAPLRLVGRVSYGLYLWHWPAIAVLTPARTGWDDLPLLGARLGVTVVGTAVSWLLVERTAARLSTRRLAAACALGAVTVGAGLVLLPSASVVPYASVDPTNIPEPSVVTSPTTAPGPPPGTLLIVGDSGMYDESPALAAGLQAAGWTAVNASYPGIGVTKPGAELRRTWGRAVREHQPDVVVVMLGGWDLEFLRTRGDDAYRRELDDAVAELRSSGARVLWLSMLPGGRTPDRPVDRLFAELPSRHEGVDYLDIGDALRAPDGSWPVRVGDTLLRKPDEWHLCPAGAAAVARMVLAHLGIAATGWEDGSWRDDARYDDPPGGCRSG